VAVTPPKPVLGGSPELPLPVPTLGSAAEASAPEHSIAVRPSSPVSVPETHDPLPPAPAASEVPYTWATSPRTPVEPVDEFASLETKAAEPLDIPYAAAALVVRVNVRELNARINGYHQELGEIEAATVVEGKVAAVQLNEMVAKLETLAGQYQLVQLYYAALTDAERQQVTAPRVMQEAIDLVNRHVHAADEDVDIFAEFDAAEPTGESPLAERLRKVAETVGLSGD
jgi:hypothetical protein